jgi:SAM-dependent methyltransferase
MSRATPTPAAYFDRQAERWTSLYDRPQFRDRLQQFVQAADRFVPPGGYVLDAGCGSGNIALALARRGYRVLGIDAAPQMIELARGEARASGVPGAEFRVADVCMTEIEPCSFDAVVSSSVLEYIADDTGLVRRLATILRPGGHLLISAPNAASLLAWLERAHTACCGGSEGRGHLRYSLRRYGRRGFERLLRDAGLTAVKTVYFEVPRLGRAGVWLSRWSALGLMMLVVARKA